MAFPRNSDPNIPVGDELRPVLNKDSLPSSLACGLPSPAFIGDEVTSTRGTDVILFRPCQKTEEMKALTSLSISQGVNGVFCGNGRRTQN